MSYNANHYDARADEDIVDVLTAISVVSRRLASNLTAARQQSKSRAGGKLHEQNERYGTDHRRSPQCCRCYLVCRLLLEKKTIEGGVEAQYVEWEHEAFEEG